MSRRMSSKKKNDEKVEKKGNRWNLITLGNKDTGINSCTYQYVKFFKLGIFILSLRLIIYYYKMWY